ncbi:MAG TPA: acyltransferase [Tepidisphaeraceae bacterium]|nr:acyltransferase [Tepidisphaeraceae bacterium]
MPDAPPWLQRGRIPSLDGARAVAIVMVLLQHARGSTGFPDLGDFHWIATLGILGVEVFFVLSGFLITLLLLREHTRTDAISLRQFYARRTLRIVPAYAAFLIVVAILARLNIFEIKRADWIAALTYTMNFRSQLTWAVGHLWSLAIEEQFYLVWPVVVVIVMRTKMRLERRIITLALLAAGAMIFALLCRGLLIFVFPKHQGGIQGWTFCRLDSIAAGCLLALLAANDSARSKLNRWIDFPGSMFVWLALLVGSIAYTHTSWKYSYPWHFSFHLSLQAMCIAALLWGLMRRPNSLVATLLNLRFVSAIGVLSYSVYLWQQLFLYDSKYPWTKFPQNIAIVFAVALASYFCIELPFLRWKEKLSRRTSAPEAAISPAR